MMLNEQIKEIIRPQLADLLTEQDKQYIEYMLEEAYYTNMGGIEMITLRPHPRSGSICPQFNTKGELAGIHNDYELIRRVGELL